MGKKGDRRARAPATDGGETSEASAEPEPEPPAGMGAFEREYEARLGDGDAEEQKRQRSETTTTTTTTTRPASDDARADDAEVHTGGVILRLNAKLKAANAERDAMKRAHDAMARDLEARRVDPSAARAAGRHLTTNRAHSLTRPHPSLSPSSPVHHRATQAAGNEIERLTRDPGN